MSDYLTEYQAWLDGRSSGYPRRRIQFNDPPTVTISDEMWEHLTNPAHPDYSAIRDAVWTEDDDA